MQEALLNKRVTGGIEMAAPAGIRKREVSPVVRRWFFKFLRIAVAAGLVYGIGSLVVNTFSIVPSDQGYLNGGITSLRAPIGGQLEMEPIQPGVTLAPGTPLFRVRNPRFGNQEAMGQLNSLKELVARLKGECAEARVRHEGQFQLFKLQEPLHRDRLISEHAHLEEQIKVSILESLLKEKQNQLAGAETRCRDAETQIELQKTAVVTMPFEGVIWSVPVKEGATVSAQETVLQIISPKGVWVDAFWPERKAQYYPVGAAVHIRMIDGTRVLKGSVESIRSGAGRIAYENYAASAPGDNSRRRIAVRIRLEEKNPFDPGEFYGLGRSVIVSLASNE